MYSTLYTLSTLYTYSTPAHVLFDLSIYLSIYTGDWLDVDGIKITMRASLELAVFIGGTRQG